MHQQVDIQMEGVPLIAETTSEVACTKVVMDLSQTTQSASTLESLLKPTPAQVLVEQSHTMWATPPNVDQFDLTFEDDEVPCDYTLFLKIAGGLQGQAPSPIKNLS